MLSVRMKTIRIHSLFSCCCILLTLCVVSQSEGYRGIEIVNDLKHGSTEVGAFRALIIAIDDYKDPKLPDLETPLNDARAIADVLQKKYGFVVETLLGNKATSKSIYKALRELSSKATPKDSVLIYYAGHGDIDKQYNDGWWIPYDAKAGDSFTYLDNVQVQKSMRSMKARHVLLISDSCYSGTLFGQAREVPPIINDKYYLSLYNEKSRWGMTSGNKTPVADYGTDGHSIFAYQLLNELKKNKKQYISTQEIYTRIAPVVSNNSEQTPLCRPIRNTGDQGGEFVFISTESTKPVKKRDKADPLFKVRAGINSNVFEEGDHIELRITPTKDAYITVFNILEDQSVIILFPNHFRQNNFVKANSTIIFPDDNDHKNGISLEAFVPEGKTETKEMFHVLALREPLNFDTENFSEGIFGVYKGSSGFVHDLAKETVSIPLSQRTETFLHYRIEK